MHVVNVLLKYRFLMKIFSNSLTTVKILHSALIISTIIKINYLKAFQKLDAGIQIKSYDKKCRIVKEKRDLWWQ